MLQYRSGDADAHALFNNDLRLKTALDNLEKPLVPLGTDACQEWRTEAEQHLRSLIIAHEELGLSTDDAITAALAQFGNTKVVGKQMAQTMQRQQHRPDLAVNASLFGIVGITLLHCAIFPDSTSSLSPLSPYLLRVLFMVIPVTFLFVYGRWIAQTKNRLIFNIATVIGYTAIQGIIYLSFYDLRAFPLALIFLFGFAVQALFLQFYSRTFIRYAEQLKATN